MKITHEVFERSGYEASGGDYWKAETLYAAAKEQKCKPYYIPIDHIDFSGRPFSFKNMYGFIYHVQRVYDTDLHYPVLVGPVGSIMDGGHRVAKAVIMGKKAIRAVRLKELPEPDEKGKE